MGIPPHRIAGSSIDNEGTIVNGRDGSWENIAILLGVNQYEDRGLARLQFAANDADLVSRTLTAALPTIDVLTLERERVTTGDLDAAISLIDEGSLGTDDQVVFFFAGHGFTHKGADYLALTDTSLGNEATWRSVTDIQHQLSATGAGKVVLILDCCRQVLTRAPGIRPFQGRAAQNGSRLDVLSFLGCGIDEVSQEHRDLGERGHGLFTVALCGALADEPTASMQRLEQAVQRRAAELAEEHGLGEQRPQVLGPFAFATKDLFGRESSLLLIPQRPRRPRLILITGPTHAGKTTFGRRLQTHLGYRHIEMSNYVAKRYEQYADATGSTESVLDFVERHLWASESEDVIARDVLEEIAEYKGDLVVTGGRKPAELEAIRASDRDVMHVYLHTHEGIRWHRAVENTKNTENQGYEAFVYRNLREFSWGLAETGTMSQARIIVNERGQIEALSSILTHLSTNGWQDLPPVEIDLLPDEVQLPLDESDEA